MKKLIFIFIITVNLIYSQEKAKYYISMDGNDEWSGKLLSPNKDKNDGPFKSIEGIEKILSLENIDISEITFYIRKGIYQLSKTFEMKADKIKNKNLKITITAYKDEKAILIGGKIIDDSEIITDENILKRIKKEFHNKIIQINLKKNGVEDYGVITPRSSSGLQLFFNSNLMTLARYPNEGWLKIYDVPQNGDIIYNKGLDREKRYDNVPVGRHYGRIKFDNERPNSWKEDTNIYLHGYWTWDWSDGYQKVKSIDKRSKEITFSEPHHHYGYTKNQRYYFLNVLEELDKPGEWYLDRENGLLYFWPPKIREKNSIIVSILENPLIILNNTQFVSIEKLEFAYSRSNGIIIKGGNNNIISGCKFHDLGKTAVIVDGGSANVIQSSDLYNLSLGGLSIKAGDRKTLTPANNYAKNNHIHHYSQWVRTGQLGIEVGGVGNNILNNKIHDAPHEGIYIQGNDHIIEYNELYNLCNETGDAGAIHTGRNYTWRGNIIRNNYFHDLKGPGLHGVVAVYLDDFSSGFTVQNNIFYKAGRGTLIGGGRDNIISNNLYIKCFPSILLDARGLGWASYYFDGTYTTLFDTMKELDATNPPYSIKYPELKNILNDNPAVPKNNRIFSNISTGGRFIEIYDYFAFDQKVNKIEKNLIFDDEIIKRIKIKPEGWEPYYLNLDVGSGYRIFKKADSESEQEIPNNIIEDKTQNIEKLASSNFQLNGKFLNDIGYTNIPFKLIGLYSDIFRKIK